MGIIELVVLGVKIIVALGLAYVLVLVAYFVAYWVIVLTGDLIRAIFTRPKKLETDHDTSFELTREQVEAILKEGKL